MHPIDFRSVRQLDRLRLAPDGSDRDERAEIEAFQVDQTYDGFLDAVFDRTDFGCVTHPYDWRKSLWASAGGLKQRIEQLAAQNGGKKVYLVAHSMGGLLVRAMLARHGTDDLWNKIGRIVFLGTPHYGSPTILYYIQNHFYGTDLKLILALVLSRATFRSLWGAIGLLPARAGSTPAPGPRTPSRGSPRNRTIYISTHALTLTSTTSAPGRSIWRRARPCTSRTS